MNDQTHGKPGGLDSFSPGDKESYESAHSCMYCILCYIFHSSSTYFFDKTYFNVSKSLADCFGISGCAGRELSSWPCCTPLNICCWEYLLSHGFIWCSWKYTLLCTHGDKQSYALLEITVLACWHVNLYGLDTVKWTQHMYKINMMFGDQM